MIEQVAAYIEKYHMVSPGDHVVAGVSGGADSVCLFLLLEKLRHTMDFSMSIVHVEHGMRGEDSIKDQEFVKKLGENYAIEVVCYSYRMEEVAKKEGVSLEEAGRMVRYRSFEKEAKKFSAKGKKVKIAVAHHGNDNVETFLFHMCRGTGIDGLCGIRPVRGDIIRPLLCVTRAEIEDFLRKENQPYCTDVTNEDIRYTRNRIRHEVVPVLQEINSGALQHMNSITEDMEELSEYIKKQTDMILQKYEIKTDKKVVACSIEVFENYPVTIQKSVALELIKRAAGSGKNITREHVEKLLELAGMASGRRISLPYGLTAEKSYGVIRMYLKVQKEEGNVLFGKIPGKILSEGDCGIVETPAGRFLYRILNNSKNYEEIPKNQCTKWFDYDKITDMLFLRCRETGDYFSLNQAGQKQKIKDYFINEKVPREMRDKAVLVAEGHHVLWAAGYRISEYYKVARTTVRILEVQFMEERK